jgi:hypothetical protein
MPMDHNQGRRGHFHRGRRGPDRRGPERRQGPAPDQTNRPERTDRVDVEQIMREIRARIAQRSGVELSNQQIQELAARRLEAILDPRGLKPELLDQLRRGAGERTVAVDAAPPGSAQAYPFDETTLYDSPNPLLRFIRKLLRPLLRMMFNPTPIAHALALQSRLNAEMATRETERDRRQAEWNALHYEILQRLALEVSRASIDAQSLLLRVESLAAKVDFNERRVRGIEGAQIRAARPQDVPQPAPSAVAVGAEGATAPAAAGSGQAAEPPRRRRRRRRGRRGPVIGAPAEVSVNNVNPPLPTGVEREGEERETDEIFEEEPAPEPVHAPEAVQATEAVTVTETSVVPPPQPEPAPETVQREESPAPTPEE